VSLLWRWYPFTFLPPYALLGHTTTCGDTTQISSFVSVRDSAPGIRPFFVPASASRTPIPLYFPPTAALIDLQVFRWLGSMPRRIWGRPIGLELIGEHRRMPQRCLTLVAPSMGKYTSLDVPKTASKGWNPVRMSGRIYPVLIKMI